MHGSSHCISWWRTEKGEWSGYPAVERGHHLKMNVLTYEGEYEGEDEEHSIAVHCERESEVSSQAPPNEELVHCRPIVAV